ncbi:MAG: hypothetical protein IIV94_06160, partial [Clostridiales bacterium]|nr:hypothetical protein [Clostridiales bacterium]
HLQSSTHNSSYSFPPDLKMYIVRAGTWPYYSKNCAPKMGHNKKSGKKGFSLIFRNKCYEKLGKFVEIAIYKNRIFFRETNDNGLTIRGKKGAPENTHYASINYISEEVERLKDFIGDYELKHDEFYELYYIEKKEE